MQDFKIVEYVKLGDFQEMEGYVVEQAPKPNAWAQGPVGLFHGHYAQRTHATNSKVSPPRFHFLYNAVAQNAQN